MKKQFYFLSPVEVVKVTTQNLEEVAEWCGGKVAKTESRRVPGRLDPYVWVPTPKGTSISWAFPGMYITKRLVVTVKGELTTTWAVFRKDYFEKNYFDTPQAAVDATWEADDKAKRAKKALKEVSMATPAPTHNIVVNVFPDEASLEKASAAIEAVFDGPLPSGVREQLKNGGLVDVPLPEPDEPLPTMEALEGH